MATGYGIVSATSVAVGTYEVNTDGKYGQVTRGQWQYFGKGVRVHGQPGRWWVADEFHELGNAVRAFETLCEPRGWKWCREWPYYAYCNGGPTVYVQNGQSVWRAYNVGEPIEVAATGNHAADVCRLVCMVLDREASDAK